MLGMNHDPVKQEEDKFGHAEMVQFNDGELSLGFRTKGDKLDLGHDSTHKYARNFDISDMAVIKTKSGNTYGLAGGLVINKNTQRAHELPEQTITITIGEPCVIPGVGSTSDVESVLLRYKVDAPQSSMADQQVDAASPWAALEAQVEAVNAARPQ